MVEEADKGSDKKKSGKGGAFLKIVILICLVFVLGAAGFTGWMYLSNQVKNPVEKEKMVKVPEPGIWPMGSIIVNLMDNNGDRYLKTTVQIELSHKECVDELEQLKPKIMDSILDLLSSKMYKEIIGYDGKQRLRDEIAVRLNGYLTRGQVRKVYFTEFIIQ